MTLYGAVAFASWFGGYRPAFLSAILGYILCNYLLKEPHGSFNINLYQTVHFLIYAFTCGIIITLGEITRNAEKRLNQKEVERQIVETELRKSENSVRTILESITDSFFTLDTDWLFSYVNPCAEQVLGCKAEDLLGKSIWTEFPAIIGTEIETTYRKVRAEKVSSTVTSFYAPHSKWYEIRAYPAANGLSVYFRDVTRRIEAERLLRHHSSELAETDRRKDEFLATLAHELRNPLAPIRNSLSLMELKNHDVSSVKQARLVIERQVAQMVRLIDDLMDVSRINHGKLELRPEQIELAWVINNAIESSRPVIEAAKIELVINMPSSPVILNADLTRLSQVFINILNNAAKFTNPGGRVNITAELKEDATNDHQKVVLVKISDNGIGIAPEDIEKIFDAFTQIPNTDKRKHGGLGVGLMLVKKLIEMHGGSINAHSDGQGLGTTFTVQLPVLPNFKTATSYNTLADHNNATSYRMRILVVDDNRDAANSLAILMEQLGHETYVVHEGDAALLAAENYQPDVVLLDIGMPGLNGYEVAEHIRKQKWGKAMKLFAVTGWGQEDDKRKSKLAGFDAHFVKPVDVKALTSLLES